MVPNSPVHIEGQHTGNTARSTALTIANKLVVRLLRQSMEYRERENRRQRSQKCGSHA